MKIKDLLKDPDSWCQGAMHEEISTRNGTRHSYCLLGAIRECYSVEEGRDVFKKIADYVNSKNPPERFTFLASWNDAPERTHQEVLDLCKKLDI